MRALSPQHSSNQISDHTGPRLTLVTVLRNMWRTEGVLGMFKGNGTNVVRIFPYSAVQFASYEFSKRHIMAAKGSDSLSSGERMGAGAFAGICSVTATYPLDIVRTRLSLPARAPTTIFACMAEIVRTEGGVVGLYRGLMPTLAGIAPYVALNFTVYEGLKSRVARRNSDPTVCAKLACGGVAGAVAQTFTYPFDVIRRRMQVSACAATPYQYASATQAAMMIVRREGVAALFKGMIPNYLKVVPSISISFVTFELVREALCAVK